jgi:hypothetical protein
MSSVLPSILTLILFYLQILSDTLCTNSQEVFHDAIKYAHSTFIRRQYTPGNTDHEQGRREQYEGDITDTALHGNVRTSTKSPAEEFVMPADVLISQANIYVNLLNYNF